METVTRFAERQTGSVSAVSTPGPEVARTLSVTASYVLSEDGRKASLLAGGNGHAMQEIALQVPANRLHLVSVDKQGTARLKLRPRFERDSERRIVRIDSAPLYDVPPTIEDLYRAAARNRLHWIGNILQPAGERGELEEGHTGIEQPRDSFARQQLAALVEQRLRALAGRTRARFDASPFVDQRQAVRAVRREVGGAGVQAQINVRHISKRPRSP